jgi:hypothetical protein
MTSRLTGAKRTEQKLKRGTFIIDTRQRLVLET